MVTPAYALSIGLGRYADLVRQAGARYYFRLDDVIGPATVTGTSPSPKPHYLRSDQWGTRIETADGASYNLCTTGAGGLIPEPNACTILPGGAENYVDLRRLGLNAFTSWSIECWVFPLSFAGSRTVFGHYSAGSRLYLRHSSTGLLMVGVGDTAESTTASLALNVIQHIVLVASSTAHVWALYLNGVQVDNGSWTGSISTDALMWIGQMPGGAADPGAFHGYVDEFAIYPSLLTSTQVADHYTAGQWTNVSSDWRLTVPTSGEVGIRSNRPTDCVATTGTFHFGLDNSARALNGVGTYSPGHANCLEGFELGAPVLFAASSGGNVRVLFVGRLSNIEPAAGPHGERITRCEAVDLMDALSDDIILQPIDDHGTTRRIDVMTNVRSDLAARRVIDYSDSHPPIVETGGGSQTFQSAFHEIAFEEPAAVTLLTRIAVSERGYIYPRGGSLIFEHGGHRASKTSNELLLEDIDGLALQFSRDQLINAVHGRAWPRQVPVSYDGIPAESATAIAHGATIRVTVSPSTEGLGTERIGIFSATVLSGSPYNDYTGNTAEDGSATDLTAYMSVSLELRPGASSFELVVTNVHPSLDGFFLMKTFSATGLLQYLPQTYHAYSQTNILKHGAKAEKIDLVYTNPSGAQTIVNSICNKFASPLANVESVRFVANRSTANMAAALTKGISSRIGVEESVTGIDDAGGRGFFINGYAFEVVQGQVLRMTWFTTPA